MITADTFINNSVFLFLSSSSPTKKSWDTAMISLASEKETKGKEDYRCIKGCTCRVGGWKPTKSQHISFSHKQFLMLATLNLGDVTMSQSLIHN